MYLGGREGYPGLKVEIGGRLRGVAKKKRVSKRMGSVKAQSVDYEIEYNSSHINTKFGVIGIKVWLIK